MSTKENIINNYIENTKEETTISIPRLILVGISILDISEKDHYDVGTVIKLLEFPVAVGGLVNDVAKIPFSLTYYISSLITSCVSKVKTLFIKTNNEEQQVKEVISSFIHRFGNTMKSLSYPRT